MPSWSWFAKSSRASAGAAAEGGAVKVSAVSPDIAGVPAGRQKRASNRRRGLFRFGLRRRRLKRRRLRRRSRQAASCSSRVNSDGSLSDEPPCSSQRYPPNSARIRTAVMPRTIFVDFCHEKDSSVCVSFQVDKRQNERDLHSSQYFFETLFGAVQPNPDRRIGQPVPLLQLGIRLLLHMYLPRSRSRSTGFSLFIAWRICSFRSLPLKGVQRVSFIQQLPPRPAAAVRFSGRMRGSSRSPRCARRRRSTASAWQGRAAAIGSH